MNAALYFEPDAYVLEGHQIMGRRSAGASFLRAAVEGRGSDPLTAYVTNLTARDSFIASVGRLDPAAPARCIAGGRLDQLAEIGTLYRPDLVIAPYARHRLRAGAASFSLCGITHTLSSAGSIDAITALATEPVMPWDAIICTSSAAVDVVRSTIEAGHDHLSWLTGLATPRTPPLLPLIPLGVHCSDWTPSDDRRGAARTLLGLEEGEVALLFAGRLSSIAKAHPFQMFEALGAVASKPGRSITLLLAGQFFSDAFEQAFRDAARFSCPNVRLRHVDGADGENYAAAFAAADIFISMADNIQETFGLTPVEAMAAGLPVIVSDWNGYRDTVRDGIDGFRIATLAPAPGGGAGAAAFYEASRNFDEYCSRTSGAVSLDMPSFVDRLTQLIDDGALRKRMGEAGRAHALAEFDWGVIYPRYRDLWAEQTAIRTRAREDTATAAWLARAPVAHPVFEDPCRRFATYPSIRIGATTLVQAAEGADVVRYEAIAAQLVFAHLRLAPALVSGVIDATRKPATVEDVASARGMDLPTMLEVVGRLAKMNLLTISK